MAKRNLQRKHERTEQQRRKAIEDEKQYLKVGHILPDLPLPTALLRQSHRERGRNGRGRKDGTPLCEAIYTNEKTPLSYPPPSDGKRIETIEVSLKTFEVVQCRGVCNEELRIPRPHHRPCEQERQPYPPADESGIIST
ncbi:PcfJ domain-containing protein, partial [Bacteroides uniformis]|nr:PcfJ domain-containing protein [Bacteroides uniformis]